MILHAIIITIILISSSCCCCCCLLIQGLVAVPTITATIKRDRWRHSYCWHAHPHSQDTSETATTTTTNNCDLLLLSLQGTNDDDDEQQPWQFSKPVRDVWRWKDAVLGDGRDFFVPKPKTLQALQNAIIIHNNNNNEQNSSWYISECVVVSNCARFEMILTVNIHANNHQPNNNDHAYEDVIRRISSFLLFQVKSYQDHSQKPNRFPFHLLGLPMDNPNLIFPYTTNNTNTVHVDGNENDGVRELSRHWSRITEPRHIMEHLCCVAAGMADRPRRRRRHQNVVFRPFSSRDAHVLLQFKRTLEIATQSQQTKQSQNRRMLPQLLQTAIRAGRAARNPKIVPELIQLRQQYGTGDTKYDIEPPIDVSRNIAKIAKQKAIDPIIQECIDALTAREHTATITTFRNRFQALAQNEQEYRLIQNLLHTPTLQLRQGKSIDESEFMETVTQQLHSFRQAS